MQPPPSHIFSDSKTAVRNFARGHISFPARQILLSRPPPNKIIILHWTPGHVGFGGAETAHLAARGLIYRAPDVDVSQHGARNAREPLLTFSDITTHYRLERLELPPPHTSLPSPLDRLWRQLQTHSLPTRHVLHHIYPTLYPRPNCPACGARDTTPHAIWECPSLPPLRLPNPPTTWLEVTGSSSPELQLLTATRAQDYLARLPHLRDTR